MNIEFTEAELKAFRAEYGKGASDSQWELFIAECQARSLRPGTHLVFQLRNSKEWDPTVGASVFVKKGYWITTIAALLLIAERTGKYDGASAPEYIYLDANGDPTVVSEIPLPDKINKSLPREPWAVRVKIRRKDFSEPIVSIVRFDSVAATMKRDNTFVLTDMWQKRGAEQCAKCALANGIRVGFPQEAGNFFLVEEIKNETEDEKPHGITPASVVPLPPPVPAVNQVPATPTDAPRPNEKVTVHPVIEVSVPKDTPEIKPEAEVKATVKEVVLAAVPGLKPASELPTPAKKRGGRPKTKSPDNGRNVAAEGGITDADIESAGEPLPEFDEAANRQEAEDFVEAVSNMTETEAAAQGLPDPPEYSKLPEKSERGSFIARARALPEPGADIKSIGDYMLLLANKVGQPSKNLTVGDWKKALDRLEAAKKEGALKELLTGAKNVPMPAF